MEREKIISIFFISFNENMVIFQKSFRIDLKNRSFYCLPLQSFLSNFPVTSIRGSQPGSNGASPKAINTLGAISIQKKKKLK